MTDYNVVALLPMKAHSERIQNKNFRMIAGKPLYQWMLDTLLSIEFIDLVVVNTDAEKILDDAPVMKNERVLLRNRKLSICGDKVSMNLVIGDDVENISSQIYLMTHTTNPLLSTASIRAAFDVFSNASSKKTNDSLFTVTKHQTRFYKKDGQAVNHDPRLLVRTQDLEPWYEENSNLYIFTRESFDNTKSRIGCRPLLYEISRKEAIDIDDQDEFDIAEAMLEKYGKTD